MYISEERIKEVISHIKAGFNNIPQRERNLSAEGINYLLDKIEEKMFVEVCVFTGIETEFYIHKVITNNYSNSNDLVKDLMELNEIYDYLISSFENYRRDIIDDKSL